MIVKIIPGDSQEELVRSVGQMVQVYESSRHIKSAASPLFSREDMLAHAPPKGMFLTHSVTLGSSDLYGANRNGDDWPHEQLLAKHGTFETHARNYREHDNRDPRKAVGVIKAARYCPKLQRGEVLFWTEIEKAAKEFEKARKGEEQHTSMAANVDHDICEVCRFLSKYAHDRCDHIRHHTNKYFERQGKYAHMININPTFKDQSWVARPADRIAHTLGYLMPHAKAAAEGRVLRGDELAMHYGLSPWAETLLKISEFDDPAKLAGHPLKLAAVQHVLPHAFTGQFDEALVEKMANHPFPGRVLRSLQNRQMLMPLPTFHSFVTGHSLAASLSDPVVKEAGEKLAGIRMLIIQRLQDGDPAFTGSFGQAVNELAPDQYGCQDVVDTMMDKIRDKFSMRYEALAKCARAQEGRPFVLNNLPPSSEAFALGTLYNAYLVPHLKDDDWFTAATLAGIR
jgi:hypothetical protein